MFINVTILWESTFFYLICFILIHAYIIHACINTSIYKDIHTFMHTCIHTCMHAQSALEFCPIHCPNGRLGQDLGFGEFAFALELPELLNRNLAAVRAKLGQTSSFPNGPQLWFPIGL